MNKIKIITERCKGCYLCIETCPKKLIEISDCPNVTGCYPARPVQNGKCTTCALCGRMCPDAAIEIYQDDMN